MKAKLLVCSLLSVAGLAVAAVPASAFCGLFCKHRHVIVCRPYNAFTPFCSGRTVCDGCCPHGGHTGISECCGPTLGHHAGGAFGHHHVAAANGAFIGMPVGMAMHPSAYLGAPMPLPMPQQNPNFAPGVPAYQPQQPQQPQQPMPNMQTYAPMQQGYPLRPAQFQPMYFQPQQQMLPQHLIPQQVVPQQVPAYWQGN